MTPPLTGPTRSAGIDAFERLSVVTDGMPASDDPFRALSEALEQRMIEWQSTAEDEQYVAQQMTLDRLTQDFILAIRSAAIAFTRHPESNNWLLHRFVDDVLESSIAIFALARQGVFNVGRRELRYLLEAVVKHVFVDQRFAESAPLEDRLAFLNESTKVPRSSVDPVDDLVIRMLAEPKLLKATAHSAFGNLSGYTHPSKRQLDEQLRRAERGEYSGFESSATLEAFNRLVAQSYDVILALVFEGIGPAFTGDLFINVFDVNPGWRFHKTKFVGEISRYFDYKAERQRGTSDSP